jgi:hypothetical protein
MLLGCADHNCSITVLYTLCLQLSVTATRAAARLLKPGKGASAVARLNSAKLQVRCFNYTGTQHLISYCVNVNNVAVCVMLSRVQHHCDRLASANDTFAAVEA